MGTGGPVPSQKETYHLAIIVGLFNKGSVDRVTSFESLGVIVANKLNWNEHVSARWTKACKGLQLFSKLIKRSSSILSMWFDDSSNTCVPFGSLHGLM